MHFAFSLCLASKKQVNTTGDATAAVSDGDSDSLTPSERAILRRVVHTQRVIYPGLYGGLGYGGLGYGGLGYGGLGYGGLGYGGLGYGGLGYGGIYDEEADADHQEAAPTDMSASSEAMAQPIVVGLINQTALDQLTPEERLIFRRIVRHRRFFFDSQDNTEDADATRAETDGDNAENGEAEQQQQPAQEEEKVVLRLPRRLLRRLVRRFGVVKNFESQAGGLMEAGLVGEPLWGGFSELGLGGHRRHFGHRLGFRSPRRHRRRGNRIILVRLASGDEDTEADVDA